MTHCFCAPSPVLIPCGVDVVCAETYTEHSYGDIFLGVLLCSIPNNLHRHMCTHVLLLWCSISTLPHRSLCGVCGGRWRANRCRSLRPSFTRSRGRRPLSGSSRPLRSRAMSGPGASLGLRVYGCAGLKVYGSTSVWVYGCVRVRVYGCAGVWVYRSSGLRVCGPTGLRVCRLTGLWVCGSMDLQICK
jgi:hypothetical protein